MDEELHWPVGTGSSPRIRTEVNTYRANSGNKLHFDGHYVSQALGCYFCTS